MSAFLRLMESILLLWLLCGLSYRSFTEIRMPTAAEAWVLPLFLQELDGSPLFLATLFLLLLWALAQCISLVCYVYKKSPYQSAVSWMSMPLVPARKDADDGVVVGCILVPALLCILQVTLTEGHTLLWAHIVYALACSTLSIGTHLMSMGPAPPLDALHFIYIVVISQIVGLYHTNVYCAIALILCLLVYVQTIHLLLYKLPFCFTVGETYILGQFIALLITQVATSLPAKIATSFLGSSSRLVEVLSKLAPYTTVPTTPYSLTNASARQHVEIISHCIAGLLFCILVLYLFWKDDLALHFYRIQPPIQYDFYQVPEKLKKLHLYSSEEEWQEKCASFGKKKIKLAKGYSTKLRKVSVDWQFLQDMDTATTTTSTFLHARHRFVQREQEEKVDGASDLDIDDVDEAFPTSSSSSRHPANSDAKEAGDATTPLRKRTSRVIRPLSSIKAWVTLFLYIMLFTYPLLYFYMQIEPFQWLFHYSVHARHESNPSLLTSSSSSSSSLYHASTVVARSSRDTPSSSFYPIPTDKTQVHLVSPLTADRMWTVHRLIIYTYWSLIMLLGIVVCAPSGRAHLEKTEEQATSHAARRTTKIHADDDLSQDEHNQDKETESTTATRHNSSSFVIPNIVIRKYYHLLVVLMFVPAIILDPHFVALAFAVAVSIFLLIEYIRATRLSPLGPLIHKAVKDYLDARDSSIVVLTHTYLLLGCALPLWFHLHRFAFVLQPPSSHADATADYTYYSHSDSFRSIDLATLYLPAISGVIVLGIGDAAASLFGIYFGSWKWQGSKKSIQGTVGAISAMMVTIAAVNYLVSLINCFFFLDSYQIIYPNMYLVCIATSFICLFEACTTQIDNLILPVLYYAALLLICV